MSLIDDFKKKFQSQNSLEKLQETMETEESGGFAEDERSWYPKRDKFGNAIALIRFLPSSAGHPYVKYYYHSFQGPTGAWFIEKCPTTIKKECPVCEANSEMWATEREDLRDLISKKRKRRLHHFANIVVLEDEESPENVGKVKIFKFGSEIFKMIENAIKPKIKGDVKFNPFDPWEGANFRFRIQKKDEYADYSRSAFENIGSPLYGGDASKLEPILSSLHNLEDFYNPVMIKKYDELKERYERVVHTKKSSVSVENSLPDEKPSSYSVKSAIQEEFEKPTEVSVEEVADDANDYFKSLSEE